MSDVKEVYQKLDAFCASEDFAGWDPFDGLNSKLFKTAQLHRIVFFRLCWLQLFKRSPINLRPITCTPKTTNAKAISLFLRSAIAKGDELRARSLYDRLMILRADKEEWAAAAWGYPFDWQAKAFFVPQGVPNVICTAYAIRALRELQKVKPEWVEEGVFTEAANFVSQHLQVNDYIAYIPGSDTLVYNASLWGAYVCMEGYRDNHDELLKAIAEAAIENALKAQRDDGAWIYGTASHHGFIDGFHTGYNLEALHLINQQLQREDITAAIAKGLAFYREHCFEKNGLAKYYANKLYPIDPHSAAQGILTLLTLKPQGYEEEARTIANAMIAEMWDSDKGCFYYQKTSGHLNKIPYMRWTQAWMHLALASLISENGD